MLSTSARSCLRKDFSTSIQVAVESHLFIFYLGDKLEISSTIVMLLFFISEQLLVKNLNAHVC